ncbi:hypothetical protein ACHAXR_002340 [Thalassiosira sp. AJA248-18]
MIAISHFAALIVALVPLHASAFAPTRTGVGRSHHGALYETEPSSTSSDHWMDVLKWDGQEPNFDVLEKAIQYTSEPGYKSFSLKDIPTDYYADGSYVFRGPIVGPVNRKDLVETNTWFGLDKAFPDLDRQTFGFAVDPENPFRVLFFERWKATHTGDLIVQGLPVGPASGNKCISPVMPFSITFNPDGKIIYECLTTAVDRFEGNTNGKVAVVALLETAGISLDNNVGNPVLIFQQKLNRFFNGPGQTHSKEEDVPTWWKSKAVGAEKNDM